MITLEIDGVNYQGFQSIQVQKSLQTLSGTFDFVATNDNPTQFPFKTGQLATIRIDDVPIINGYIDRINVRYSANDHIIQINGRDKTQDLIDSTLPEKFKFTGPITFDEIIRQTLARLGITDINVIVEYEGSLEFKENEVVYGEIGKNAFEFLENYARKIQVLLTSDSDGNIVITRASEDFMDGVLRHIIGDNRNNILNASIKFDNSERFHEYFAKSQDNWTAYLSETDADPIIETNKSGIATDPNIRLGRVMTFITENSSSNTRSFDRAAWEANSRRANSFVYSCEVNGFYTGETSGELWIPNRLVTVQDQYVNVNADLLINTVTYRENLTTGHTTFLELITQDAYTLDVELKNDKFLADQQGTFTTV